MYDISWKLRFFLRKLFRKFPFCFKHIEKHIYIDNTHLCLSCARWRIYQSGEEVGKYLVLQLAEKSSKDWLTLFEWARGVQGRRGKHSFIIGHAIIMCALRKGTGSQNVIEEVLDNGLGIIKPDMNYIDQELSMQQLHPPIIQSDSYQRFWRLKPGLFF